MINKGVKLKDIIQAKKLLRENGYAVIKISELMKQEHNDCANNIANCDCTQCECNVCILDERWS